MSNNDLKHDKHFFSTIMLVDDDITVRLIGREILEKNKFNFFEADNGWTGIELFAQQTPDLVLLDVKMPGMNGYEVCQKIRQNERGSHIPIVMMTGLDDQQSIDESYRVGATDFVTKPINWTILLNRIRYILRSYEITKKLDTTRSDLELAIYSLKKNQELLEKAQTLAKIGSWELNIKDNILFFSDSLYSILEIKKGKEDISFEYKMKNVKPLSKNRINEMIDVVKTGKIKQEIEYLVEYKKHNENLSKYVREIIEYKNLPEPHLLGTVQDITESKKNEIELFKLNANLEERVKERTRELDQKNDELYKAMIRLKGTQEKLFSYKKMVAFSEILVGISHEIRNPLNFVINFSDISSALIGELKSEMEKCGELVKNNTGMNDIFQQLESNVKLIYFHTRKIESIINAMLKHVDIVPIKLEKNSLIRIANQSLKAMVAIDSYFSEVVVIKHYQDNLPDIYIMATEIGRVFIEFLKDACFFMSAKATMVGEAYQPELTITIKNMKKYIKISIRDNGIGIPKGLLDKVLTPFFTTKPTGQGVGLGLSLAWEIITVHHGGKLKIDSQEGEYCQFSFYISKTLKEQSGDET